MAPGHATYANDAGGAGSQSGGFVAAYVVHVLPIGNIRSAVQAASVSAVTPATQPCVREYRR